MKIETNIWYVFNSQSDKQYFLDVINQSRAYHNQSPLSNMPTLMAADCLKLVVDKNDNIHVNYRSTYSPEYMPDVTMYTMPTTKLQLNSLYGKMAYKENNMSKINSLINLINKKEQAELDKAAITHRNNYDEFIANTDVAKSLDSFVKLFQERTERKNNPAVGIVSMDMLADDDKAKLKQINLEFEVKQAEIRDKYAELRELIQATDTFAEAYLLLKAYDIVRANV